jgi:hypothetical protein
MSLLSPRRMVYKTMVALSKGEVSIDHCFAMAKLAEAERHLAAEDRLHLELAIANGYNPMDYTDAMEVISLPLEE